MPADMFPLVRMREGLRPMAEIVYQGRGPDFVRFMSNMYQAYGFGWRHVILHGDDEDSDRQTDKETNRQVDNTCRSPMLSHPVFLRSAMSKSVDTSAFTKDLALCASDRAY